jgi:hypothetical protein
MFLKLISNPSVQWEKLYISQRQNREASERTRLTINTCGKNIEVLRERGKQTNGRSDRELTSVFTKRQNSEL